MQGVQPNANAKPIRKPLDRSGLAAEFPEVNIAIEPARERGAEKKNQRDRRRNGWPSARRQKGPGCIMSAIPMATSSAPISKSRANRYFREPADEVQSEKNDQRAGDRCQQASIADEKSSDGAGGGAERNKDDRKSEDKRERRCEQSAARRVAFLQLLDADAGQHGDITGHQRQHAWREKRYESRNKRRKDRNFHQTGYALFM